MSRSRPTLIVGGLRFRDLSAGDNHSCGVTTDSIAYCWGDNVYGQLGNGVTHTTEFSPVPVSGGLKFVQISAAIVHTCGITADSTAYCWGAPGRIGDGTGANRSVPTAVAGGAKYVQISANYGHTCAVTANRAARCWGTDANGAMGDGSTAPHSSPVPVAGGHEFVQISAGRAHTCALTPDRIMYCWGRNLFGELGDGTTTDRLTPAKVIQ
jgi:alpha-tubulin suppressor-like RCC1 family protein